jgi:hypothetical protein
VFFYMESFYNRRRRHSVLDYLSPEDCERLFHQGVLTFAQPRVHRIGGGWRFPQNDQAQGAAEKSKTTLTAAEARLCMQVAKA